MNFYAVFSLILTAVYLLLKLDFVPSYFCKGVIISSLNNKHGDATAAGNVQMNYDLLVSPVMSKLSETVLQILFEEFLVNDHLQFGYRYNSSGAYALFILLSVNRLHIAPVSIRRCSSPS